MAKPIAPIPTFRGEAARWLTEYLSRVPTAEALDVRKRRHERDKEIVAGFVPLSELRRPS